MHIKLLRVGNMEGEKTPMGAVKTRIQLYSGGFNEAGHILLCENGICLKTEEESVKVPYSYVQFIDRLKDLPLAKVLVGISLYDQVGAKISVEVGMADMHYNELKRACGK